MSQSHAGIKAFNTQGAGARNPHSRRIVEYVEFQQGFNQAQFSAQERALQCAADYHALSVRDNAKDRAWAAKLVQA
ncbi:hypothetical protein LPN04_29580 [Rugamonas sp. A1-17]|nr:hypothetical protein [Rugamonas sp. A1-17]